MWHPTLGILLVNWFAILCAMILNRNLLSTLTQRGDPTIVSYGLLSDEGTNLFRNTLNNFISLGDAVPSAVMLSNDH